MTAPSDARLEAALRDVLAELRPAGEAPDALRLAVRDVPERARPTLERVRARLSPRTAGGLAGLAAAAAIGTLFLAGWVSLPVGHYVLPNGGVGGPSPGVFDPTIEGPGVLSSVDEQLRVVPWLAVGLIWVVLGIAAIPWERRRRIVALAIALVLGAGALALTRVPGIAGGSWWGPSLGLDLSASPPAGSSGPDVWYVTAEANQPFVFVIGLHNPGPLPVRYLGIEERNQDGVNFYRWVAAWQHEGLDVLGPATSEPFHPVDLEPGAYMSLYVVARAGPCAAGSTFRLDDASSFGYSIRESITVAYSVAGLTSTTELPLGFTLAEPAKPGCPG